ncbi:MAG: carboxypeptidase regulatory-like domain-containing protein [Spirochaetales bacterium]|nr:carboxypeptidase regulatory-like domain-containing protein [Spirochaetales bacterium]
MNHQNRVNVSFILKISLFFIVTGLPGCNTIQLEQPFPANLPGMIYDNYNNPVAGAEIYLINNLSEEEKIFSDIDGRFLLTDLPAGEWDINVSRKNYETVNIHFNFTDPKQVLYIKISSIRFYKNQIEAKLKIHAFDEVENLLNKAKKISPADPILLYLSAIYYFLTGSNEEALSEAESIGRQGINSSGLNSFIMSVRAAINTAGENEN